MEPHTKTVKTPYSFSTPISSLIVLCVFSVAILSGWAFMGVFDYMGDTLLEAFVVNIMVTIVVFLFSLVFQNSSIFDPYPAVASLAFSWYWYERFGAKDELNSILGIIAITLWSIRRLVFYFSGWVGLGYEDARYVVIKRKYHQTAWVHWVFSFLVFHLITSMVFFVCLVPLYYVLVASFYHHLWLLIFGFAVSIFAFLTDSITFWFGLWIMAMGVSVGYWWTLVGPMAMTLLVVFAAYPYLELRYIPTRHWYN